MSAWLFVMPAVGLVAALLRIWTIVRDARSEPEAVSPALVLAHSGHETEMRASLGAKELGQEMQALECKLVEAAEEVARLRKELK